MKPHIIMGLINITSALLIIAVSLPLMLNKVRMNHLYGIRFKKSFESEDNWSKINVYGGRQLIFCAIPIVFVGICCFFIPINIHNRALVTLALGVAPISICILVAVIRTLLFARKV